MAHLWLAWMRFWGWLPPKDPQPEPEPVEGYPEWKEIGETVIRVDFEAKRRVGRRQ